MADLDDDLYGGYTDSNYALNAMAPGPDPYGAPAGGPAAPGARLGTAARGVAPPTGRLGTAAGGGDPDGPRPMTSMKAAGYSSQPAKGGGARGGVPAGFDPLNQGASKGPAPALQKRSESGPEEMCREIERKVNTLLEESAEAGVRGDPAKALELAKEAGKVERQLSRQRESLNIADQNNFDLTYSVCFNLAHQYHRSGMLQEALQTYSSIVKNKQFGQAGRLRVNMGNIYFEQGKYPNAIKMFRMALDQVSVQGEKEVRFKIMRNIGLAFVKQGLYHDATQSFETVLENLPDVVTGFNLVVCYRALGDKEKMKKAFVTLLEVGAPEDATEEELDAFEQEEVVVRDDGLKEELRKRKTEAKNMVSAAARLVAPVIDKAGIDAGYQWVIGQLTAAGSVTLANELEMDKALSYLRDKKFEKAVEVLKEFERKEHLLKAKASTNLSFLYFLEDDIAEAEKYAEMAVSADRYSATALVNRGNCLYTKGEYESALSMYLEAVGVEADCVEAIYNLGLVNKKLGNHDDALVSFTKLNTIMPNNVEAIFQIAACYDALENFKQAVKWFETLQMRVPNDPGVLARVGAIWSKAGDEAKALHSYTEAHRVYPVNMDVISWLGAFHVQSEVYEKAMPYFDLAAKIQPQEVKWQLMVASCFRRIGALQNALGKYMEIHRASPDNVECLRYLVHLCTDLNRKDEVHDYVVKLRKAERAAAEAAAAAGPNGEAEGGTAAAGGGGDESPMPVAKQGGRKVTAGAKSRRDDDDEWGGGLGDDLLPGF